MPRDDVIWRNVILSNSIEEHYYNVGKTHLFELMSEKWLIGMVVWPSGHDSFGMIICHSKPDICEKVLLGCPNSTKSWYTQASKLTYVFSLVKTSGYCWCMYFYYAMLWYIV